MLDFSEVNGSVFRIPSVPFVAPIAGDSLAELGLAAWKVCSEFYEEQSFSVTEMRVELVWPPEPHIPKYRAWVQALSHG